MKKTLGIIVLIGVIVLIVVKYNQSVYEGVKSSADFKNGTSYSVGDRMVTLQNGKAEVVDAPGSASKTIIQYFGNEVEGDFDGNGKDDVAFIITQNSGGSGTFYYMVAALKIGETYIGTNAVLLGDRIAPQSTEFKFGQIIVNYADRKPDEPFSEKPTVGKSKYLEVTVSSDAVSLDEAMAKFIN